MIVYDPNIRKKLTHYLDAKLVKFLLNKYEILTIHDSFGIDMYRISLLIDNCNSIFNNNIVAKKSAFVDTTSTTSTFSIFILL